MDVSRSMKDKNKQHEFIKLRANNYSFQKISEKIGVSKNTLIKWDKEFKYEILNLENIELESLYEQYKMTAEQRVKYLGELQEKILLELEKRDLSEVKTDKLLDMLIKTSDKIQESKKAQNFIFRTEKDIEKIKAKPKLPDLELFQS